MVLLPMNQTALLKVLTGRDGFGKPTYSSTSVQCRFIPGSGIKRTKEGDEIKYRAKVFLTNAVKPGDVINYQGLDIPEFYNADLPVLDGVHGVPDISGAIQWYSALL